MQVTTERDDARKRLEDYLNAIRTLRHGEDTDVDDLMQRINDSHAETSELMVLIEETNSERDAHRREVRVDLIYAPYALYGLNIY